MRYRRRSLPSKRRQAADDSYSIAAGQLRSVSCDQADRDSFAAGDTDTVQLVFGDDAPAGLHAAWAADSGSAATEAAAAAIAACGADADASTATTSGVTEAESARVARLVAALTGAVFDSGDARGVALSGTLAHSHIDQADSIAAGPAVQPHVR